MQESIAEYFEEAGLVLQFDEGGEGALATGVTLEICQPSNVLLGSQCRAKLDTPQAISKHARAQSSTLRSETSGVA